MLESGFGDVDLAREGSGWRWLHVPARELVYVRILRAEPVRYRGHYWGGQMYCCTQKEDCQLCRPPDPQQRVIDWQQRYVLPVIGPGDPRPSLWDFGSATAADLEGIAWGHSQVQSPFVWGGKPHLFRAVVIIRRVPAGAKQPVRAERVPEGVLPHEASGYRIPDDDEFSGIVLRGLRLSNEVDRSRERARQGRYD